MSTCSYGDGDLVKTAYSVLQRRHFLSFGDVISFRSEVSKVFFPFYCSFPCLHLAPTLGAGLAITVKAGDDEKDEEVQQHETRQQKEEILYVGVVDLVIEPGICNDISQPTVDFQVSFQKDRCTCGWVGVAEILITDCAEEDKTKCGSCVLSCDHLTLALSLSVTERDCSVSQGETERGRLQGNADGRRCSRPGVGLAM